MSQRPKEQTEVLGNATQQGAQGSSEPSTCLYGRIERKREIKESGIWSLSATKSSIRESRDSDVEIYPLSHQNQHSHQRREKTEEKNRKKKEGIHSLPTPEWRQRICEQCMYRNMHIYERLQVWRSRKWIQDCHKSCLCFWLYKFHKASYLGRG